MRFEQQTIVAKDTKGHLHSIEDQVARRDDGSHTGPAVHQDYLLGPGPLAPRRDEHTANHLHSGWRVLGESVNSEAIACRWLEYIAPFTDWTQPAEVLRPDGTLRLRIRLARVRATWDEDVEHDLFAREAVPHRLSPTFTLESLTALIKWIADAMDSEEPTPPMQPALETLLIQHAQVALSNSGEVRP